MTTTRTMKMGLAGAAAAALMAVLVAQPAAASDGLQNAKAGDRTAHKLFCVPADHTKATGCFQPYGEVFRIVDLIKDGDAAAIYWRSSSGRAGEIHDHLGKGDWGYVNKSFGESTTVTFHTRSLVNEHPVDCGSSTTISAGVE
ncbi:MAG: hypothetical protein WCA46_22725 [Actinocatenispora sp.]